MLGDCSWFFFCIFFANSQIAKRLKGQELQFQWPSARHQHQVDHVVQTCRANVSEVSFELGRVSGHSRLASRDSQELPASSGSAEHHEAQCLPDVSWFSLTYTIIYYANAYQWVNIFQHLSTSFNIFQHLSTGCWDFSASQPRPSCRAPQSPLQCSSFLPALLPHLCLGQRENFALEKHITMKYRKAP